VISSHADWRFVSEPGSPRGEWLTPRRASVVRLAAACLALAGIFLYLRAFYRQELYHFTGNAQWIWVSDDVDEAVPTACVFYRTLELHERPLQAVAKVCGDRSYVLWINGQVAVTGYNRPRYHLDVVPVTDLVHPGPNLIVIEARSPTSVGGVLFSMDLVPSVAGRREGDPRGRNVVFSDRRWAVVDRPWSGFPGGQPEGGRTPWVWGRPPDHPWTYPVPIRHTLPVAQAMTGVEIRIGEKAFREGPDGVWRHDLSEPFDGLLWLEGRLPGAGALKIRMLSRVAGPEEPGFRPVVTLPGQTRWLLAGSVHGSTIEIESNSPPPALRLTALQPGVAH